MKTIYDIKEEFRQREMATDPETMMNHVNSDPGHIARAKAKATRVKKELQEKMEREAMQAKAKAEEKAKRIEKKRQEDIGHVAIQLNGIVLITFLAGTLWGYISHAMMMF